MTGKPPEKKSSADIFVKVVSTFFGAGYCPWAPGTAGSVAGVLVAWFTWPSSWVYLVIFAVLGFAVARASTRIFSSTDPSQYVMDEVCGVMIAVLWLPKTWGIYLAGFALFRFFDILKPWPISRIQRSKAPSAILWDDLVAGLIANVLLRAILVFIHR